MPRVNDYPLKLCPLSLHMRVFDKCRACLVSAGGAKEIRILVRRLWLRPLDWWRVADTMVISCYEYAVNVSIHCLLYQSSCSLP